MSAPLRIGLVADTWFPARNGVVSSVVSLRSGLRALGHDVTVIAVGPRRTAPRDGVHLMPGLPVVPSVGARLGAVSAAAVERIARADGLDVLHTHTEFTAGWAGRRAAARLGLPLVHTLHTPWDEYLHYLPRPASMLRTPAMRLLARFVAPASLVVVPSAKAGRWAAPLLEGRSPLVVGNAVAGCFRPATAEARRQARVRLGFRPEQRVALVVGRVAPEKRVGALVAAMAPELRADPCLVLAVVGSGPELSAVAHLARRLGIRPGVHLAGDVPWHSMPQWYAASDVFVSASHREFQPVAALEALASGLPLVVGPDAAFDAIVEHDRNGLRAVTDGGIAAAVARLASDPLLRRRLGAGSVAATGAHRAPAIASAWADQYRVLVGSARPARAKSP